MAAKREPAKHPLGQRKTARHPCNVPVSLWSKRRRFEATMIDLSPNGAMFVLPEIALKGTASGRRGGSYLEVVDKHFGGGFHVAFPGAQHLTPAEVVRLVQETGETGTLRLGCRFKTALAPEEFSRIMATEPPKR
jgi:hypothetical protein